MPPNDTNAEQQSQAQASWPIIAGSYRLGDPAAPVAVCALTSDELLAPLALLPGVAIVGEVHTANLGIEHIILNITANPAIRFLLLCGKDSRLFRQGQSLAALFESGVDESRRIIGAEGYEPVLRTVTPQQVAAFRSQVELVDWAGERDLDALRERISGLAARNPGRFGGSGQEEVAPLSGAALQASFRPINPGGQREPLIYDPKGYFVITLDRPQEQILARHYLPDHTPAHEMRGRTAESMLLGLIREGLISQLSHAGYLGAELAKAEAALRLGVRVRYEQDRVLRRDDPPSEETEPAEKPAAPAAPPQTMGWEQFSSASLGQRVDVTIEVTALLEEHLLEGTFAEPSETDPYSTFLSTRHVLRLRWSSDTKAIMGQPEDFQPGALLRAVGSLRQRDQVDAAQIVVKRKAAITQPERKDQPS
jgi:tetrahydromethanopterin S-methyltransferase subunit A